MTAKQLEFLEEALFICVNHSSFGNFEAISTKVGHLISKALIRKEE